MEASESDSQVPVAKIRVYYVGRKSVTAETLKALFARAAPGQPESLAGISAATNSVSVNGAGQKAPEPIEFVALSNQKAVLRLLRVQPPKLFLVEIDAKSNSRIRFCEMLRYRLPTAAIIAVGSAQPQSSFAFDGFLSTPPVEEEVLAAIERIRGQYAGYVVQRGPIRLNVATRTVFTPNGQHHMTPKQCALLQYLMARHNQIVKRSEIMRLIWETTYLDDTRTLDVHVRWLRECIEPDPSNPIYLLTVRGSGYQLQLP
jgi:DNA-binding response OmpR family regulator